MSIPIVLSIAGSDPSGGAGIQADLKTFSALGAYGCAVITSLTAQSTRGVSGIYPIPSTFVHDQVTTLTADVRLDAVKIGMLGTSEVVGVVHQLVRNLDCPVVLDPVMVSTAGSRLLDEAAIDAVRALAADVDLITPNLAEAAVLLGNGEPVARTVRQMIDQAQRLQQLGGARVLITGGDTSGPESVDVLLHRGKLSELRLPRVNTRHTHGTGCTLSSAIAALVAQNTSWLTAVGDAKTYVSGALQFGDVLRVGAGPGPVHHFHQLWGPR